MYKQFSHKSIFHLFIYTFKIIKLLAALETKDFQGQNDLFEDDLLSFLKIFKIDIVIFGISKLQYYILECCHIYEEVVSYQ